MPSICGTLKECQVLWGRGKPRTAHSSALHCCIPLSLPRPTAPTALTVPQPSQPPQADLRDTPLADLRLPVLFVRGTRDDFSTQPHFDALLDRMRGGGRGDQVQVRMRCV